MSLPRPRYLHAGDAALVVEFGDAISPELNEAVLGLDAALTQAAVPGVLEAVPTYRSLLVQYDPRATTVDALVGALEELRYRPLPVPDPRHWEVPVVFGGEWGIDLEAVAAELRLSADEVVHLFTAAEYRVYMIGFVPGYSYLGPLPERLHIPRRQSPRAKVPAGSIGIGGIQAGLYSVAIPSGWHLLGRTPLRAFDKERDPPFLFRTGDRIRFVAIDEAEFRRRESE